MKILFLSQRVPYPPNKGDKLRSFNIIKHLSRNHKISLLCLSDNAAERKYAEELSSYCCSVDIVVMSKLQSRLQSIFALFSSRPLTCGYFCSEALKTLVAGRLQSEAPDLVLVYCSSMAQYVEHLPDIPKLLDFVDIDSEKWSMYARYARFPMKHLYRLESRRLRKYEAVLAESFQHSFFVSEQEAADFKKLVSPFSTISPVQNGVDCEMFKPSSAQYDKSSLVFTGAMDYFANIEAIRFFVAEILPLIRNSVPRVTLTIVGSNPSEEIRSLPGKYPNITVTGSVDSVQPYVVNAAVFVAPMRIARGVQNKILEAMAMGVPVVTTSSGFEGISAVPGRDIFVENEPERFARQVVQLMSDDRLRGAVSKCARNTVEEYYSWSANLAKLERILVEACDSERCGRNGVAYARL